MHYIYGLKWLKFANDKGAGFKGIITHKLPLEEASKAYQIINNREDECIKVILKP